MTVLGGPVLALSLLYLAVSNPGGRGALAPFWMLGITAVGALVVMALAVRTAWTIALKLQLL